jgi:hypothetical protein
VLDEREQFAQNKDVLDYCIKMIFKTFSELYCVTQKRLKLGEVITNLNINAVN